MKYFQRIVEDRRTVRRFIPDKSVADDTLDWILRAALRAPSSFNLQPWRIVVVQSPDAKKRVAKCMPTVNGIKVKQAPLSVVLLADKESLRTLDRLKELERNHGKKPESYVSGLGSKVVGLIGGALGP